jgi:hypothetical protein
VVGEAGVAAYSLLQPALAVREILVAGILRELGLEAGQGVITAGSASATQPGWPTVP